MFGVFFFAQVGQEKLLQQFHRVKEEGENWIGQIGRVKLEGGASQIGRQKHEHATNVFVVLLFLVFGVFGIIHQRFHNVCL